MTSAKPLPEISADAPATRGSLKRFRPFGARLVRSLQPRADALGYCITPPSAASRAAALDSPGLKARQKSMNFNVVTPRSLDDALGALASGERLVPLAGGTDLMVYIEAGTQP